MKYRTGIQKGSKKSKCCLVRAKDGIINSLTVIPADTISIYETPRHNATAVDKQ